MNYPESWKGQPDLIMLKEPHENTWEASMTCQGPSQEVEATPDSGAVGQGRTMDRARFWGSIKAGELMRKKQHVAMLVSADMATLDCGTTRGPSFLRQGKSYSWASELY